MSRHSSANFEPYKYPTDYSFFPSTRIWPPLHFPCSFFFLQCLQIFIRNRPLWLIGSQPQPKDSAPTPPRWRNHLLRKIYTNSFPGRSSGSTTSPRLTARSSRNAGSPPPMRSSTSLSRAAIGRRSLHPLFPEWPRSCGSFTPIYLHGCHHRLRPRQVGRVLCQGH